MTVSEMISRLERIREEEGDLEVRMTYQPNYPLQSHIRGIATSSEIADAKFEDEEPGSGAGGRVPGRDRARVLHR